LRPYLRKWLKSKETQEEVHAKFGQDIESVMGIGPVFGGKLRELASTAPFTAPPKAALHPKAASKLPRLPRSAKR